MTGSGTAGAGGSGSDAGTTIIRTISGFRQDDEGDWVAELSCRHSRHMRHEPPFQNRPWVVQPAGRRSRIGSRIRCQPCERAEMPAGLTLLRTAGPFSHDSLPAGLRRPDCTAAGVWGLLRIISGGAGLRLEVSPPVEAALTAGHVQPIPPEVPYLLTLTGPVRLSMEYWGSG